jgi:CelD/BcsL family acetyltransferase involved in cellulose biosynthesis
VWIAALDPDGQALAAVRRGAGEAGYRVAVRPYQSAPYLQIEGRWSDYRAGLSANLAKDLRRSRRRLDRQGEVAVEIADGHQRLEALLAEAFAVEAAGWKGRRSTAIRSRPETRLFYTEVARWAAREGMLRLLFLRLDGRPIAMLYALETAGVCHLLKGGYDPAFRRASPGKLLLDAALRHGFETGLGRIELHGDAEPYKLRWTGAVVERQLFEAFSRSPAGWLSWAVRGWGRRAARRLLGRPDAADRTAPREHPRPTEPEVTR